MLRKIKITDIKESPWQGRLLLFDDVKGEDSRRQVEKLARDIKENGLMNPVIVRQQEDSYELVDGHRRVLACRLLGLKTIDAIVRELDDRQAQISSVSSNLQRRNLSGIELALAYKKILDSGIFKDKKELSITIGKDETYIGDLLNTLNMDNRIIDDLKKNKSINDVRMLRAIRRYDKTDNKGRSDKQWELYNRVLSEKLPREKVLDITREPKNTGNVPLEQSINISFTSNKAEIELPVRLSKDQKRVFVNLIKDQIQDILKTIIDE